MDFLDAINAHVQWKLHLEQYIDGTGEAGLDPAVVGADDRCRLGLWIYGEGRDWGHMEDFLNMREVHARFHELAGEVIRRVDAGDRSGARALLAGDYALLSRDISATLIRMGRLLGSGAKG